MLKPFTWILIGIVIVGIILSLIAWVLNIITQHNAVLGNILSFVFFVVSVIGAISAFKITKNHIEK